MNELFLKIMMSQFVVEWLILIPIRIETLPIPPRSIEKISLNKSKIIFIFILDLFLLKNKNYL
jgi:hypothetical protein